MAGSTLHLKPLALQPRRGFTLIELLVVVGIIALLISILLPALQRARQAAEKAVCASNLRQIAVAMLGYNNDNKGTSFPFFPINAVENGVPVTLTWYNKQTGFLESTAVWSRDGLLSKWLGTSNVYECPTIKALNLPPYYPTLLSTSYGLNSLLAITGPSPFAVTNLGQIRQPSQTVLLAEALAVVTTQVTEYKPAISPPCGGFSGTASYQFIGRHGTQGNVVFFDGHVESTVPVIPPQSDISTGIVSASSYARLKGLHMGLCVPKGIDVSQFTDQASMTTYLSSSNASYWFWVNKQSPPP